MWKFSLREVVLVTTLFGIAMGVNVWNHRALRMELAETEAYAMEVEAHAHRLHSQLGYAKEKSDETNAEIRAWLESGELKPIPRVVCLSGRVSPDWAVLNKPLPNRYSLTATHYIP